MYAIFMELRIPMAFPGFRASTRAVLLVAAIASFLSTVGWLVSRQTYLVLGFGWLGIGSIGVGFFQGKIFWSSLITFSLVFGVAYYVLAEKQKLHYVAALALSGLILLSGAYLFEFAYLFLIQTLSQYVFGIGLWFNLLAGLIIGFTLSRMKVNKLTAVLTVAFVLTMITWYLGGYPQLNNKETLVVLYTDYIGIPANWSLPLNVLGKGLATMIPLSLLVRNEVPMPSNDSRVIRWGVPLLTFGTVGPLFLIRLSEAAATFSMSIACA